MGPFTIQFTLEPGGIALGGGTRTVAGLGVNAFLKGGVPVACQGERDGPFHVRENIVGDGGWLGLGAHRVIVAASRAGHYTDAPSVSCFLGVLRALCGETTSP